ncbi:class I SAM-dependent methyltransferase [candidate division WOR-3 bacterium]|nr:class I SAM-dependent methyltransferase [candidate division WOR-3 bacterium]
MLNQKQRFTEIFNKNLFGGKNSRSGEGSSLEQTHVLRLKLQKLLSELNIKSILDAPCGDWNWMQILNLEGIKYIGVDIVDQIIKDNKINYIEDNVNFMNADIIEDKLPVADLVLCRDCLVHLTYKNIFKTIINFKKSKSRYLLTTTFPSYEQKNRELLDKQIWRALNMEDAPFCFPKPIKYIVEHNFNFPFHEKTLALWCLNDLM